MEEIYKSSLLLIHAIGQLNGICNQYHGSPNEENGEKIFGIVDKCEEKFLKVKEEIVRMVREIDSDIQPAEQEVSVIETEGGFLISDRE